MKDRTIEASFALLLICLLLFAVSCTTQKKCWRKYPPQVKDSISYVEKLRDTTIIIPADSSWTTYLVECQKTAEGYQARIIQLEGQQQGHTILNPTADIRGNVLTARAAMPEQAIKLQLREFHYAAVKSQVYVKITNLLTWWQKLFVGIGIAAAGVIIAFTAWRAYKFFK
jgi:hypothetical protein